MGVATVRLVSRLIAEGLREKRREDDDEFEANSERTRTIVSASDIRRKEGNRDASRDYFERPTFFTFTLSPFFFHRVCRALRLTRRRDTQASGFTDAVYLRAYVDACVSLCVECAAIIVALMELA